MADYTNSKETGQHPDPESTVDAGWKRYEPLLKGSELRRRFLFGIPLVSPVTKEKLEDSDLDGFIQDSVAEVEAESGVNIFPTQHNERYAFDRNEYNMMGYFRLSQRPVASIEALQVVTSNDQAIWTIANDWIDTGYLAKGLIYIVPINIAVAPQALGMGGGGAAGGAAFLAILGQQPWVPAYWRIRYTSGFKDGVIPRNLNILVGCQAAIDVLNVLAAANAKSGSKSISLDSMSQSSSNPGPDVYKTAVEQLTLRKTTLMGRLRNTFGTKIFSGNV